MTPTLSATDILWLHETDSTNNEAHRRFDALDNLSVVAALSQTAGRGQGDHKWFGGKGNNLMFSICLKYPSVRIEASDLILVTCFLTLGIRDYLSFRGIDSLIKWPNDIFAGERKICGILIENKLDSGSLVGTVAGIGLNVNQTSWPSGIGIPVSMKELTGIQYDLRTELLLLHERICRRYFCLESSSGRDSLQDEFGKYMFKSIK